VRIMVWTRRVSLGYPFTTLANIKATRPSLTLRQNMIYLKISVYFSV
jgi:hypothetical protein